MGARSSWQTFQTIVKGDMIIYTVALCVRDLGPGGPRGVAEYKHWLGGLFSALAVALLVSNPSQ